MNHTPTPYTYHVGTKGSGRADWIEDADGNIVVENVGHLDGPFIVRACNSHEALVNAATVVLAAYEADDGISLMDARALEAALKLARGE